MVKTVIVLGAGASCHLQFPTGAELISIMRRFLLEEPQSPNSMILEELGHKTHLRSEFAELLRKAQVDTIDELLTKRIEFTDIGKDLISLILLQFEYEEHYHYNDVKNWYRLLYKKFKQRDFEALDNESFKIATFNYERSLEYYFWHSLQQEYSESQSREIMDKIKICHVHGNMGSIFEGEDDYMPYNFWNRLLTDKKSIENVANLISKIRGRYALAHENNTIREKINNTLIEYFRNAMNAWYLGFGYSDSNLRLLPLSGTLNNSGTAYGYETWKIEDTRESFSRIFNSYTLHLVNLDCYSFLEKEKKFR